jgi:hypothetical protein
MKKQIQILVIILCLGIGAKGQSHGNDIGNSDYFIDNFQPSRHFNSISLGTPDVIIPNFPTLNGGGSIFIGGQAMGMPSTQIGFGWNVMQGGGISQGFGDRYTSTRTAMGMYYYESDQAWILKFSEDNNRNAGDLVTFKDVLQVRKDGNHFRMNMCGKIYTNEVNINSGISWCDYVFADDYKLMSLPALEAYIKENKHLPEVPSEKEVMENGISVTEMLQIQMKKIEELTLYIIALQKQLDELKNK